jgi:hypothetical protein
MMRGCEPFVDMRPPPVYDGRTTEVHMPKPRKPDPTKICSRMHKGWAFMQSMTVEQYRQEEEKIERDLDELTPEAFLEKYKTWMY